MSVGAPPNNAKPPSSPLPQAVKAGAGDTLRHVALRVLRDERAVELLLKSNPGIKPDEKLAAGATVKIPEKEVVQKWAAQMGVVLGLDVAKGTGTRQKRAWKAFQSGPSVVKATPSQLGPDALVLAVLCAPGKDATGPGVVTAELLKDTTALAKAVSERMQWLGVERFLTAAMQVDNAALQARAQQVATALKSPTSVDALLHAVHQPLAESVAMEALKEARKLVARAQQALGATATGHAGGMQLLGALRDADADARIKLLTTLAVPKVNATAASQALDKLQSVKAGLAAAAMKTGKARTDALSTLGIMKDRITDVAAALHPPLAPNVAEELALKALGLDATARQAAEGANAMHTLVQKAVQAFKAQVSPPTALVHLNAARASVYAQRGITLDPATFPPETEGTRVLEAALASCAEKLTASATKLPDVLRVAWRSVEALGPNLAVVDANALGRGVGCLLARVASAPTSHAPAPAVAIRSLRPGDLLAMSGAAAARAQTGVDATRTLVPMAAALAVISRFPYVEGAAPPTARLELRRRLTEGFRAAYAQPNGLPLSAPQPDHVRMALGTLMDFAALQGAVQPDAAMRTAKVRAWLEADGVIPALASTLGNARYKFRRDEMSLDGKWLCTVSALMDRTWTLSDVTGVTGALNSLLHDEGGRLLDATERALLEKLG